MMAAQFESRHQGILRVRATVVARTDLPIRPLQLPGRMYETPFRCDGQLVETSGAFPNFPPSPGHVCISMWQVGGCKLVRLHDFRTSIIHSARVVIV
jgi:hypothetical protein